MVYSAVSGERAWEEFRRVPDEREETEEEFERLPADDAAVERLAARMAPVVRKARRKGPQAAGPTADSPQGAEAARNVPAHAVAEIYTPAQIRLLQRVNELLDRQDADDSRTGGKEPREGEGTPPTG